MKRFFKFIIVGMTFFLALSCEEKKENDSASTLALLALTSSANSTQICGYQTSGTEVRYTLYNASTSATSMGTLTSLTNSAVRATVTAGQKVVFTGVNFSGSILSGVYTKSACPISASDLTNIGNYTKTNNSVGSTLSYEISFSVAGTYIILFQGVSAQGVNVIVQ